MSGALSFTLALLAAAASPPAVIRVGDVAIGADAVSLRAADVRARGGSFRPEALVDAMIDEAVLAADARRSGLDREVGTRALVEGEVARVLADLLVSTELSRAVKPSEEVLQALFHQSADTVRLQLLILPDRGEAAAARARLEAGGEFALEAARSLDPVSSRSRGETPALSRIQMDPLLAEPAFREPVGRLFGPTELSKGWAVARVLERTVGDEAAYQAKRPSLLPMATTQAVGRAREHLVAQLRARARATVDEAFLDSLGQRVEVTAAELERPFATIDGRPLPYRELLRPLRRLSGGKAGGHMLGAPVKKRIAWSLVDDRLLAAESRARGFDAAPAARTAVALAEINALSIAAAEAIRARQPAGTEPARREEAVRRRIKALRKELRIEQDRKAALAAAGAAR